jgi:hypothetical protein
MVLGKLQRVGPALGGSAWATGTQIRSQGQPGPLAQARAASKARAMGSRLPRRRRSSSKAAPTSVGSWSAQPARVTSRTWWWPRTARASSWASRKDSARPVAVGRAVALAAIAVATVAAVSSLPSR